MYVDVETGQNGRNGREMKIRNLERDNVAVHRENKGSCMTYQGLQSVNFGTA